ncbi:MAG: hypothetical protein Q8M20_00840 [Rhodocyclaceae bacterium]|nr:hypothetical protein [Rhodocyclaceae bacterium]MDZ4214960.1 type IIL restriction-modification enzyme MmeI [Rhodocyclaceae bacterium]
MNAVEIEAALSDLALEPFAAGEFPFAFLAAFGEKDIALKRLRAGTVGASLKALRASPATTKAKAKFLLATDGETLEAEELVSGETIACTYPDFPDHFGFFLPLAGISTIKEIKDNPVDVRATGRLNKLYVELLRENPDWAANERRPDMNHFMARLVFCFFAEDTDIFNGEGLFTHTVEQMSDRDGSNTEQNKADLTTCAENILLAREAHFPATIADLYDPETMPENLRHAHERNDEVLERIYIGRRFKNDTERLEKLFELYTKMTAEVAKAAPKAKRGKKA